MAFDLSTAKPIEDTKPENPGFDLSTAKPVLEHTEGIPAAMAEGLAGVGNRVDTAASMIVGGLPYYLKKWGGREQWMEDVMSNSEERKKSRLEWAKSFNPKGGAISSTDKLIGNLPLLPEQMLSMFVSPFETAQQFTDAGESNAKTMGAIGIDSLANAAMFALPAAVKLPSFGGTALTGGGIGLGQYLARQQSLSSLADTPDLKKELKPNAEDASLAFIQGGLFGPLVGFSPNKTYSASGFKANEAIPKPSAADVVAKVKEAQGTVVPEPTYDGLVSNGKPLTKKEIKEANKRDDATVRRLTAAVEKQNPEQPPIAITPEGQAVPHGGLAWKDHAKETQRARVAEGSNELYQTELFDQPESGRVASPYEASLGDWRVDENGIPIKVDKSLDALNVENPLQRNLWGDELPATRNPIGQAATLEDAVRQHTDIGQGATPLTEAIDSMPWAQRRGAIKRELSHDLPPGPELEAAMEAAKQQPMGSRDPGIGPGVSPGGHGIKRGAIDPDLLRFGVKGLREYAKGKNLDNVSRRILAKFKGTFDTEELRRAMEESHDPSSRERLVWMSPDEFLKIAEKRDNPTLAYHSDDKRANIREALQTEKGLNSIPSLKIGSRGIVWYHEGRHRMDVFKEHGLDLIPVKLETALERNGELNTKSTFIGQNGTVHSFPEPIFPKETPSGIGPGRAGPGRGISRGATSIPHDIEQIVKGVVRRMRGLSPEENVVAGAVRGLEYVPKGEDSNTIITKALAQGDGPSLWENVQSGTILAAKKENKLGQQSALLDGIGRHLNWAEKAGIKYSLDYVRPLEKALTNLSKTNPLDFEILITLRKEAQNAKTQFSEEVLRSSGVSESVIKLYNHFNAVDAKALEIANQGRAASGRKPITGQEAYFSSQWSGNWHLPIKDANGNLVGYVKTETRYEANKARNWIQKNHPEWNVPKAAEYRDSGYMERVPGNVAEIYESLLEAFKGTPMEADLRSALEQFQTESAYGATGVKVHFEPKKGVRFFLGDRPWLSNKENMMQGAKSQIRYYNDMLRWGALQEVVPTIREVLSHPDLIAKQPNNVSLANLYLRHQLGLSKDRTAGIVNDISKALGVSPSSFGKVTNDLKTLTYLIQLGYSGGYVIATPAQAFILGPSWHMDLSRQGYKHNPVLTAAKAVMDGSIIMSEHAMADLAGYKKESSRLSPLGREAKKFMEDNGEITANLFDEYGDLGEHAITSAAKSYIGPTITAPEKVARIMTFMSYAHHLEAGGHPVNIELFRKSSELTNHTLTNFSRNARPELVAKTGALGELGYVYKSPLVNYYNNLSVFARQAINNPKNPKAWAPFISAGIVQPLVLGGIFALPMVSELDGALDLLKGYLSKNFPNAYPKISEVGVREQALKHLPDVLTYGALSTALDVQLASRFSNQVMDPENPMETFTPALQQIGNLAGGTANFLANPNEASLAGAMYANTPPAVRGNLESSWDVFNAGQRGDNKVFFNPNKIADQPIVGSTRTPSDIVKRRLGMTSMSETRNKDERFVSNQKAKQFTNAREKSIKLIMQGIQLNDKEMIAKYAEAYMQNHGDGNTFDSDFNRAIKEYAFTQDERQVLRANTLAEIMALQDRMQLKGK